MRCCFDFSLLLSADWSMSCYKVQNALQCFSFFSLIFRSLARISYQIRHFYVAFFSLSLTFVYFISYESIKVPYQHKEPRFCSWKIPVNPIVTYGKDKQFDLPVIFVKKVTQNEWKKPCTSNYYQKKRHVTADTFARISFTHFQ